MYLRPLLVVLFLTIGVGICRADGSRVLKLTEERLSELKKDMVLVQRELKETITKQNTASGETADHLKKAREELEVTVIALRANEQELQDQRALLMERFDLTKPCPICGGKLVKVRSVAGKSQGNNTAVWNNCMCGMSDFTLDSPVCSRCWVARSSVSNAWIQSSDRRAAFVVPLHDSIMEPPKPPQAMRFQWHYYRVVELNGNRMESASFSYVNPPVDYLAALERYARDRGLEYSNSAGLAEKRYISISRSWRVNGRSGEEDEGAIEGPIPGVEGRDVPPLN